MNISELELWNGKFCSKWISLALHHINDMIISKKEKLSLEKRVQSENLWHHLPLNKCVLMNWNCEKSSIAHLLDCDDCPYKRLVIYEIKKTFIFQMSKKILQPISKLDHCLSTNLQPQKLEGTLAFLNKIWSIECTMCYAWAGLTGPSRVRLMQEFHKWRVVASAPSCPMLICRPCCTV